MWLALIIVPAIVLSVAGLALGVLPMLVPGLLLLAGGLLFHFTVMRSKGDSTGGIEKGPDGEEGRGHPEDGTTSGTHAATGHAHGGQKHMVP